MIVYARASLFVLAFFLVGVGAFGLQGPLYEHRVIREFIKDGDTVFDIGANVGEWSCYVLEATKGVELFAFEPTPETFEQLRRSVVGCCVKLYDMAMGTADGNNTFFVYDKDARKNSFWDWRPSPARVIRVKVRSIDSFCVEHAIDAIDFLKIDAEGAEYSILLGARRMLAERRIKKIQFEYTKHPQDKLERLYKLLRSYGFDISKIEARCLRPIKSWHRKLEDHKFSNFLAILRD